MPGPQRLTRRFPARMSEAGYRRLRKFAEEVGLDEGEALSFVFENIDTILHPETTPHRLAQHQAMLAARRPKGGSG
ncbi:MAG: hypothetical protein AAFY65_16325 [Pseudomonadota bacterium]